jgi:hypothetical protein
LGSWRWRSVDDSSTLRSIRPGRFSLGFFFFHHILPTYIQLFPLKPQTKPKPITTMKSILALALLPIAALAAPTYGDDHKEPMKHDDHSDVDVAYPFQFTSTLVAFATPNNIINNSQVAVPGLPEGWGEYRFGLNSIDNVICYVSCSSGFIASFYLAWCVHHKAAPIFTHHGFTPASASTGSHPLTSRTSPCGSEATTPPPPSRPLTSIRPVPVPPAPPGSLSPTLSL